MGDSARVEQANNERDFLVRELARAFGLSGRSRRASSAAERARVSVTHAVRQAMTRIREHNPPLGEHLDRCFRLFRRPGTVDGLFVRRLVPSGMH